MTTKIKRNICIWRRSAFPAFLVPTSKKGGKPEAAMASRCEHTGGLWVVTAVGILTVLLVQPLKSFNTSELYEGNTDLVLILKWMIQKFKIQQVGRNWKNKRRIFPTVWESRLCYGGVLVLVVWAFFCKWSLDRQYHRCVETFYWTC